MTVESEMNFKTVHLIYPIRFTRKVQIVFMSAIWIFDDRLIKLSVLKCKIN